MTRRFFAITALTVFSVVASVAPVGATTAKATLTTAQLRSRYLSITAPVEKAFVTFSANFPHLLPGTPHNQVAALVSPMTSAMTTAAQKLAALAKQAPKKIATQIKAALADDNLIYQALLDLKSSWGSRGFEINGWTQAFGRAISSDNAAALTLQKSLGIKTTAG